ncbi:alginate lyase family protein [Aliiglaciecola sp. 2_MG-2023]|uniref:alginate lyase family protein n=1 Tax=unclassified Aliiglaciecola TaxID=2593648 RepID=UPI0026E23A89|nr:MULTISPECIES: alginate lyase family protein [unclassified Aliiglaciecola]MDO6712654.1 alginate lyase family protein [Aliiglaciecola sp. 2_MG-2023]MDO6754403.1 alginate lyase family protein [Aliiglaciecola sp. 1_MG-2023]
MNLKKFSITLLSIGISISSFTVSAKEHPNLILTEPGVERIRANLGQVPLFDESLATIKQQVDVEIALGIDTPIPKDFSGGYTHQRHKLNFFTAQKAGVLYQVLEDEKYAKYIRDMLFQYEAMYKDLPLHPQERSYARGKLFWQCLNDSNWLVYMSQAYDAIYDYLSESERDKLETNLFRPFADFLSLENPQFFNRVHNHSTWGVTAVGMIGLVMDDEELIQRALYGIEDDGLEVGGKDNDGGTIKVEGQRKGFFANLEEPFSPDGYYTEGPYYQRYAMYPFLILALAMENNRPELKVLQHKDNVLFKGVNALLNLSDADGEFFPINDGQKGMSYYTSSLVSAVNLAYFYGDKNPELLSIVEKQGQVLIDESGLEAAIGVRDGKAKPFAKKSINLSDGINGKQGGIGILRYGNEDLTLVFKYAAQGLSHGHYDKLSYSLYEKGDEVLQDYGLARFVNIEQKGGGNYLKENTTWAKTTIAHNTLSVNEKKHFNGSYDIASQHHSELFTFDAEKDNVQVVSATESNAYPGTSMHRTMAMIKDESFEKAFLLDIMRVKSDSKNQYDLPYYFMGQVLDMNFAYDSPKVLRPLGEDNGYQHLFVEGKGNGVNGNSKFSWLGNGKYYTLTAVTDNDDELLFTRIGANDPEFNLRRDASLLLRRNAKDTLFVSVIEPHGSYGPVTELSQNSKSNIADLNVVVDNKNYTGVTITDLAGNQQLFIIANDNASKTAKHSLKVNGKKYSWTGPYFYQ